MGRMKELTLVTREENYERAFGPYPQSLEAWNARLAELEGGAYYEPDELLREHWARRPKN